MSRSLTAADATTLNLALTALGEPTVRVVDRVVQDQWVQYYTDLHATTASVMANLGHLTSTRIGMLNGVTRVMEDADLPEEGELVLHGVDIATSTPTLPTNPPVGGSNLGAAINNLQAVTLTGNVDDHTLPTGSFEGFEFSTSSNREIRGMVAPASDSQQVIFFNRNTSTIKLKHQNTNASAVNRFELPENQDFTMEPNTVKLLVYYDDLNRWILI